MKILVIGSGLIGVTSAYVLRRRGHEVTVIDRQEGPGRETSFANGALLTPSMPEPWNAPGCWRVLLSSLGRSDAPMQLRWRSLPGLMGWGVGFLRNSRAAAFERNALTNLRLALYSIEIMKSLRQQTHVEYGCAARGTLRIFRDHQTLDDAFAAAQRLALEGLQFKRLSQRETVACEPGLQPIADQLAGALHYDADETGDAHRFCEALASCAREQGVEFRSGTTVASLQMHAGRITGVACGRDRFVADRYIVAAGSHSAPLLRRIGIQLPVRPAKGYSITFERPPREASLRIPVIDHHLHAVVVPLDGAIRVAGTAEFAGYDLTLPPVRILNLLKLLQRVLPEAHFDPAAARPWCGLRPMSADGVPVIGPTPIQNLLLNTGHGHLGWTMAAGSAQLLADLISGGSPMIDPTLFALARFSPARWGK
jgi:D-amino-acid dehydrogenase